MHDLYVGDEAVVDVRRFTLDGGRYKGLRQAVNRIAKYGYTDPRSTIPPRIDPELRSSPSGGDDQEPAGRRRAGLLDDPRADLRPLRRGPAASRGPRPRRRAGGLLPVRAGGRHRRLLARPHAPRRRRAPQRAHRLRHRGDHQAPAASTATTASASTSPRCGRSSPASAATAHPSGSRPGSCGGCRDSMQIESLWRFNAKFDPDWQPRYAVYDSPETRSARRRGGGQGRVVLGAAGHRPLPEPERSAGGDGRRSSGTIRPVRWSPNRYLHAGLRGPGRLRRSPPLPPARPQGGGWCRVAANTLAGPQVPSDHEPIRRRVGQCVGRRTCRNRHSRPARNRSPSNDNSPPNHTTQFDRRQTNRPPTTTRHPTHPTQFHRPQTNPHQHNSPPN